MVSVNSNGGGGNYNGYNASTSAQGSLQQVQAMEQQIGAEIAQIGQLIQMQMQLLQRQIQSLSGAGQDGLGGVGGAGGLGQPSMGSPYGQDSYQAPGGVGGGQGSDFDGNLGADGYGGDPMSGAQSFGGQPYAGAGDPIGAQSGSQWAGDGAAGDGVGDGASGAGYGGNGGNGGYGGYGGYGGVGANGPATAYGGAASGQAGGGSTLSDAVTATKSSASSWKGPQAVATWYNGPQSLGSVKQASQEAKAQGRAAALVMYDAPNRDAGGYSAGGAGSPQQYLQNVAQFAQATSGAKGVVVLEPDRLSQSQTPQTAQLLAQAAQTMKQINPNLKVVIDVGQPSWTNPEKMASLVRPYANAFDGFSTNVSNFKSTEANIQWGQQFRQALGVAMPQVVDTSRNGNPNVQGTFNPAGWQNGINPGQVVAPLTVSMWIKPPGESDT